MHEHTPQLSLWPVLIGLAITLIAVGILATWISAVIGIALLLYSLWGWTQENRVMQEMHTLPAEGEMEEHPHE